MSDIDVKGALEALRPLVRQTRAVLVLSEKLDSLVGLDQHKDELTAKIDDLKKQVAQAEKAKADAEREGVRICSDSKQSAGKLLKDASDAAERCIADAEKEAEAVRADAATAKAELEASNDVLRQTANILQAAVDDLTVKRDNLRTEIENFKAVAGRIIG